MCVKGDESTFSLQAGDVASVVGFIDVAPPTLLDISPELEGACSESLHEGTGTAMESMFCHADILNRA